MEIGTKGGLTKRGSIKKIYCPTFVKMVLSTPPPPTQWDLTFLSESNFKSVLREVGDKIIQYSENGLGQ